MKLIVDSILRRSQYQFFLRYLKDLISKELIFWKKMCGIISRLIFMKAFYQKRTLKIRMTFTWKMKRLEWFEKLILAQEIPRISVRKGMHGQKFLSKS
jgi:hypothetical protein